MKLFRTIFEFFILMNFIGCQAENRNNSRAYVEGKLTGNTTEIDKIRILLFSENANISEAVPTNSADFVISGPMRSERFSLKMNRKIKSFSASKPDCSLSSDGQEIIIPAGITYIVFTKIELE